MNGRIYAAERRPRTKQSEKDRDYINHTDSASRGMLLVVMEERTQVN